MNHQGLLMGRRWHFRRSLAPSELSAGKVAGLPVRYRRPNPVHAHGDRRSHQTGTKTGRSTPPNSSWLVPTELLPTQFYRREEDPAAKAADVAGDKQSPLTVYTVRLTTGFARGAALSEPNGAVNVCLLGKAGRGILHRIPAVNDPAETRSNIEHICSIVGDDAGADCSVAISGSPKSLLGSSPPPAPPKRRFQEGAVDEVSFVGQDLGALAGLLVGTEVGTWYLDEADVVSSRSHHIDRFVCRRLLGAKVGEGASLLAPVPPGAVVYGEGEQAVVLTQDQASALRSINMSEYESFKSRLLVMTALLVAGGGSLAALAVGLAAALPFVVGGGAGIVYQWMLMQGVDHVVEAASASASATPAAGARQAAGTGSSSSSAAGASASGHAQQQQAHQRTSGIARVVGSTPVRLGFVCICAALAGMAMTAQEQSGGSASGAAAAAAGGLVLGSGGGWQLLMGALGFMTYKIALVGVYIRDGATATASNKQYEKA